MNLRSALLVILLAAEQTAVMRSVRAAESVNLGTETQLFVDDDLISQKWGVTRRAHACQKLPQPVLEPERAWERDGIDQRIYVYGTVLRDEQSGLLKLWYNRGPLVMYATSTDGLQWERAPLGLHACRDSKENNIVFTHFSSPSIIRDEDERDPAKRYKMLGYSSGKTGTKRGYSVAFSTDGLQWQMYPKAPVIPGGDTCTLAQNPRTGELLAFFKRTHMYRGHLRRLVYLATSKDMQDWSEPTLVMAPDGIDDRTTQAEGGRYSQFYNMSVFPRGGQFLGLVTHFRFTGPPAEKKGPAQSPDDGPIDVQLVHSRDGRQWQRCEDRSPVIPNGPSEYDAGCILGVSNGPVVVGDQMWLYYTAITTTHGGYLPKKRITIARAGWRRDGFVSLDADSEQGIVETVLLRLKGARLFVNADASSGSLAVEVLDDAGQPLPGFTRGDCAPIFGDQVRCQVRWKKHEELLAGQPVRFRFVGRHVRLYSFQVQ